MAAAFLGLLTGAGWPTPVTRDCWSFGLIRRARSRPSTWVCAVSTTACPTGSESKRSCWELDRTGTQAGLITIDLVTGKIIPIIENHDQGAVEWETASPRGLAYFPRFQVDGDGELVEKDVGTGEERTILRFPTVESTRRSIRHLALSADGLRLAYIQRIDGEGGEIRDSISSLNLADGVHPKIANRAT